MQRADEVVSSGTTAQHGRLVVSPTTRAVAAVLTWLVATAGWALFLTHHFFPAWPHGKVLDGDLTGRLNEVGEFLHRVNPFGTFGRELDTLPPAVSIVYLPLYAAGPTAAGYVSVWLSAASIAVITASAWAAVSSIRRSTALVICALVATPIVPLLIFPAADAIATGQDQLWLMALVVVDLLIVSRRRVGALVGIAAGLGVWPAIFVVAAMARGRRRAMGWCAAGFGTTLVASLVLSASGTFTYWAYLLPSGQVASREADTTALWPVPGYATPLNGTLNGMLARAPLGGGYESRIGYLTVAVVVLAAACVIAWFLVRRGLPVTALTMLAIAVVDASPLSWYHHWVWSALLLPFAAVEMWKHAWWVSVLLGLYLLVFIRQVANRAASFEVRHHHHVVVSNWYNFGFLNRYALGGLVLMIVVGLWLLVTRRQGITPAPTAGDATVIERQPVDR